MIDAMENASEGIEYYLDKRTGEVILITEDDRSRMGDDLSALQEQDSLSRVPEWRRESVAKAREIELEPDHFVLLPDPVEIHEYKLMEDFCLEQNYREVSRHLRGLIQGGAFRRFKNAIRELGVENLWDEYKAKALEQIAIEWLEENKIPFTRDDAGDIPEADATM